MRKRLLASLMCVCMLIGLLPTTALAVEEPVDVDSAVAAEEPVEVSIGSTFMVDGINYRVYEGPTENSVEVKALDSGKYTGSIVIPNSVVYNGTEYHVTRIRQWAFYECSGLTEISIPEGVTDIGEAAFQRCTSLQKVVFPTTIENIDKQAFDGCTALRFSDLPVSLKTIGDAAFRGCTSIGSLTIPGSVTKIVQEAFKNCGQLTKVVVDKSKNKLELGNNAFSGCSKLCEITLNNITVIPKSCFNGCTALETISIPDGVEIISDSAFYQCTALDTVTLPNQLKEIGDHAFYSCSSLTSISFPESLNKISASAFNGCRALNSVFLNEGLSEVGTLAFYNTNLHSVLIPDTLTTIGDRAFEFYNISPYIFYVKTSDKSLSNIKLEKPFCHAVTNGGTFAADTQFETGKLATPTKENYKFGGWYENEDCTGTALEGAPQNGKTYYAKWERSTTPVEPSDMVRYVVQHYKADKSGYTLAETEYPAGKIGTTVTATPKTYKGYTYNAQKSIASGELKVTATPKTYKGYTYNAQKSIASGELKEIKAPEDIVTLKLYYDMNSTPIVPGDTVRYVVEHYKANKSGYTLAEREVLSGKIGATVTAVPKTYTGYTHDPHAAGTVAEGTLKKINSAEDIVTLKLFYGLNVYLVTVESDGHGSASASSASATMGETVTLTAKADSGYRFKAWEVVSGAVTIVDDQFTMPAENVTVRAIFQRKSSSSSADKEYSVSVDDGKNGTVTVSPKRAEKGDTVTITVKPDKGYELDELIVTDSKGREIDLREKGENKFTFKMPGSKVTVEATFRAVEEIPEKPQVVNPFVDVNENAYYHDAVLWAVEKGITGGTSAATFKGITGGTSAATFSPDEACTRAQMVTFLWRAAGSPVVNYAMSFTDVPADAYYAEAVRWAVSQGITAGTSASTFDPNATVTRGQTVTFLWRAAGSPVVAGDEAVRWAVSQGITAGTSASTFDPNATVTRGQTVTFLWRAAGSPVVAGDSFADVAADAYYAPAVAWAVREGITAGIGAETFAPSADCTRGQIVTFLYRDMAK